MSLLVRCILLILLLGSILVDPPASAAQTVSTLGESFAGSGDVAVGPDAAIYIGNFGRAISQTGIDGSEVLRMSPDGRIEVFATGFQGASGNAFDFEGNLYQSDIRNKRVVKISPEGAAKTFIEGDLRAVIGVAFDSNGAVYVSECNSNRVTRASPDGQSFAPFATSDLFNCPNGLTTGPDGHLYAVNFSDGRVLRVSLTDSTVTEFVTLPGAGNGHITSANGRLYATSFAGNQVFEITMDAEVRLLAGSGKAGAEDGPALESTFFQPNGIAASVTGDTLYVNSTSPVNDTGELHPNVLRIITGVHASTNR